MLTDQERQIITAFTESYRKSDTITAFDYYCDNYLPNRLLYDLALFYDANPSASLDELGQRSTGERTPAGTVARTPRPTTAPERPTDATNPSHYRKGTVECIDALETATSDLTGIEAVCTANAIKYLWRWKQKNGAEDLRKAQWCIAKLLAVLDSAEAYRVASKGE
jgi:hypothetical protein